MFPERLKEIRKTNKLNQTELAKGIGVTNQTVSNWENSNIAPSVEMVIKIADFFQVSTDFLLDRNQDLNIGVKGLSLEHVVHIQAIVNDLQKSNEEQKKSNNI
ncbi:MAG: helix-turn-helix transcriptional regulator [Longicatena sp.]